MSSERNILLKGIKELLNKTTSPNKLIVLHSSLAKLGPSNAFSKWDALYFINVLYKEGWTIALPAFTFDFCKKKIFSTFKSKSETGILADWVLENLFNSKRTRDPIYSFVVLGPLSEEILKCSSETAWGDNSPFEFFEKLNAVILMLGCSWDNCTQIHRYEEINKVPYRMYKIFEGDSIFDFDETRIVSSKMFVRDYEKGAHNNLNNLKSNFESLPSFNKVKVLRGTAKAVLVKELAKTTNKILKENPYALLRNPLETRRNIENISKSNSQDLLKIALLGHSNQETLKQTFEEQFKKLVPDRKMHVYCNEYGQINNEIMDLNSNLNSDKKFVRIFTSRIDDFGNLNNKKDLRELINIYVENIKKIHERQGGWTFVFKFASSSYCLNYENFIQEINFINQCNSYIENSLKKLQNVIYIDINNLSLISGIKPFDERLWFLGKFPFSREFSNYLATQCVSMISSLLGKSIRLIILDLDNTIWGGVLGEDGFSNLSVDGDYPGNAFNAFQRDLISLRDNGIALAVASKNDFDLVQEAFQKLENMPLKLDMFSSMAVNWESKVDGIKKIAKELNLGFESILFIDDNPAEISIVRECLPSINLIQLPNDPSMYVSALRNFPLLKSILVTNEDKKRIAFYEELKEFKFNENKNITDYLKSLNIEVTLSDLTQSNLNRSFQLCQKTNQFNTSSKRYSAEDLQLKSKNGLKIIVIGHKSKGTSFENMGLMIFEKDIHKSIITLDLYLLSCRILGRGIEDYCLSWASNYFLQKGFSKFYVRYIPSLRNKPALMCLQRNNFKKLDDEIWYKNIEKLQILSSNIKFNNKLKF